MSAMPKAKHLTLIVVVVSLSRGAVESIGAFVQLGLIAKLKYARKKTAFDARIKAMPIDRKIPK